LESRINAQPLFQRSISFECNIKDPIENHTCMCIIIAFITKCGFITMRLSDHMSYPDVFQLTQIVSASTQQGFSHEELFAISTSCQRDQILAELLEKSPPLGEVFWELCYHSFITAKKRGISDQLVTIYNRRHTQTLGWINNEFPTNTLLKSFFDNALTQSKAFLRSPQGQICIQETYDNIGYTPFSQPINDLEQALEQIIDSLKESYDNGTENARYFLRIFGAIQEPSKYYSLKQDLIIRALALVHADWYTKSPNDHLHSITSIFMWHLIEGISKTAERLRYSDKIAPKDYASEFIDHSTSGLLDYHETYGWQPTFHLKQAYLYTIDYHPKAENEIISSMSMQLGITPQHCDFILMLLGHTHPDHNGLKVLEDITKKSPLMRLESNPAKFEHVTFQTILRNSYNQNQYYPIDYLTDYHYIKELLALYLKYSPVHPSMLPCFDNQLSELILNIDSQEKKQWIALLCTQHGYTQSLKKLLDTQSLDLNYTYHCLSRSRGATLLDVAIEHDHVTILGLIMEHAYRFGDATPYLQRALFTALEFQREEILEYLLSIQFECNRSNDKGYTALHLAARYIKNEELLSKLFTRFKSQLNIVNLQGETPVLLALYQKNLTAFTEIMKHLDQLDLNIHANKTRVFGNDIHFRFQIQQITIHTLMNWPIDRQYRFITAKKLLTPFMGLCLNRLDHESLDTSTASVVQHLASHVSTRLTSIVQAIKQIKRPRDRAEHLRALMFFINQDCNIPVILTTLRQFNKAETQSLISEIQVINATEMRFDNIRALIAEYQQDLTQNLIAGPRRRALTFSQAFVGTQDFVENRPNKKKS